MNKKAKTNYINKIKQTIKTLDSIQLIITKKTPTYLYLTNTISNAGYSLTNILIYIEGKHPYFSGFDDMFLINTNALMHRTFFSDLHISVENELKKMINNQNLLPVEISRNKNIDSVLLEINNNINNIKSIRKVLETFKIKTPQFGDYLNTALMRVPNLEPQYKKDARCYFDALTIIRNKVSHSDMHLSEIEINKIKKGKLGKVIAKDNTLRMTFEGYEYLIRDIINFFDKLYSHF